MPLLDSFGSLARMVFLGSTYWVGYCSTSGFKANSFLCAKYLLRLKTNITQMVIPTNTTKHTADREAIFSSKVKPVELD